MNSPKRAGLWIADENAEIRSWKRDSNFKNNIPYDIKTDKFNISEIQF